MTLTEYGAARGAGAEKVTQGTYAALDAIGHAPVRVTEQVSARMPTYSEATVLQLKPGVPVLQVAGSTFDAERQVVE